MRTTSALLAVLVGCGDNAAGPDGRPDSGSGLLSIQPDTLGIYLYNGEYTPVPLVATVDGVDVTQQVIWTFDRPELAAFSAPGRLEPTGAAGGLGVVTASFGAQQAVVQVAITIRQVLDPDGISWRFGTPLGEDLVGITYPFNDVVFPRNAAAPEIQLNNEPIPPDVYFRISIQGIWHEYTIYVTGGEPFRYRIPDDVWSTIVRSSTGPRTDPQIIHMQRHVDDVTAPGTLELVPIVFRIADAELPSLLYYEQIPDCSGTGQPTTVALSVSSSQPRPITAAANAQFHAVSRDGTRMVAAFGAPPYSLQSLDLSSSPETVAELTVADGLIGTVSAHDPTGARLLFSNDGTSGRIQIADASDGTILNPDVFPGRLCGEPAWSPDGTRIAAICDVTGFNWIFDSDVGSLVVADLEPTLVATNVRTLDIHAAYRLTYPSFSPDSEWIAFGRKFGGGTGGRPIGPGEFSMVNPDSLLTRNLSTVLPAPVEAYHPTFAPVQAGGYYWLAFSNRGDYGNRLVGADREQIWVIAVRETIDPSEELPRPFYVSGQDPCHHNSAPVFAPAPF